MSKIYNGHRFHDYVFVTVTDTICKSTRPLDMRLDLVNHSPTGFEWGYGGSGPAQLSLAILADCLNDELALRSYQVFKTKKIASLDPAHWSITEEEIIRFLREDKNAQD